MARLFAIVFRPLVGLLARIVVLGIYLKHTLRDLSRKRAAFQRIRMNAYGTCLGCGKDIAMRRLEREPAARRCGKCAS